MIAKLVSIQHLKNALSYCEKGGELLQANKCFGNSDDVFQQMSVNNSMNDKCQKQSFHIKIRIAPEDKGKLNNNDWINISKKYALKIGFENNPYAVYIHEEGSEKEHIHIVASRIKEDNTAVNNSFTHYKNMDFAREIEKEYHLRAVTRRLELQKVQEKFKSTDSRIQKLKLPIFNAIENSSSTEQAIDLLAKQNIKVLIGRGINFIDKDGVKLKGSQIDRKLSKTNFLKLSTASTLPQSQGRNR